MAVWVITESYFVPGARSVTSIEETSEAIRRQQAQTGHVLRRRGSARQVSLSMNSTFSGISEEQSIAATSLPRSIVGCMK